MDAVESYARAVVDGDLLAGKYHRLACARHLRDLDRQASPDFPFLFQIESAERFFRFASKLRHYEGKQWAGQRITLSRNQIFRLGSVFGWRQKAHPERRRFTTAYNELPRKQGKSLEAGAVSLYVTFYEDEPGAQGYIIATKRDQAKIVFKSARLLALRSGLKARLQIGQHAIAKMSDHCTLQPLGGDADSTDGLNPNLFVVDEFHALKDRDLLDVMESATGARLNWLSYQITTAGDDPLSPCGDQHDYACGILDEAFADESTESFFAFIAHADPADDPFEETTWQKANPHYGISVLPEDIKKLALKAQRMPSALNEFKQKRLNVWVSGGSPWLDVPLWREGQTEGPLTGLDGQTCYAGLDLSSKIDLSAVALVFPPPTEEEAIWRVLLWSFVPLDRLEALAKLYRVPLRRWVDDGWLTTTPGNKIDHRVIKEAVLECHERYDIQQLGFDEWNIGNLDNELNDAVHADADDWAIKIPQNYGQLSETAKEWEALVLDHDIDAGGNPILTWNVSNAVVEHDNKGNIFPTRNPKKMRGRIDGLMASLMGMKLARRDLDGQWQGDFTVTSIGGAG